jgi:hypothetical protein
MADEGMTAEQAELGEKLDGVRVGMMTTVDTDEVADKETLDEDGSPKVEGTQDEWTGKARGVIERADETHTDEPD